MEKPSRAISSGPLPPIVCPQSVIEPVSGDTTPAMAFSSVDLPAPFGPVTNRVAAGGMMGLPGSARARLQGNGHGGSATLIDEAILNATGFTPVDFDPGS